MSIRPTISFTGSKRLHLLLLAFTWVLVQVLLFLRYGIEDGYEAVKYIEQARLLLNGQPFTTDNFWYYFSEIGLIALSLKLTGGFVMVVAIQLLLSAASAWAFYRLLAQLTGRAAIAFVFSFMLVSMWYYQAYNVYLFTESVFFSLSILLGYTLYSTTRISAGKIAVTLLLLLALVFTRPTGMFFLPAVILFYSVRFGKNRWMAWMGIGAGASILFSWLLNRALGSGGEWDFLLPYQEAHIICGVPTLSTPLEMNAPKNYNSLSGLWYIISHHTNLFFSLAVKRLVAFFGAMRSYYASGHNVYLALYFYPVYLFAVAGLFKSWRSLQAINIFLLAFMVLVVLTVMLTCDEWHNRFLFTIYPFLLILAAAGFRKKP